MTSKRKHLSQLAINLSVRLLLTHDDGVIDAARLQPGSVVPGGIDEHGRKLIQPLDMPTGQLHNIDRLMEAERATINDAFLVTLSNLGGYTPDDRDGGS